MKKYLGALLILALAACQSSGGSGKGSGELIASSVRSNLIDTYPPHGIKPIASQHPGLIQQFPAFVSETVFDRGARPDGKSPQRLEVLSRWSISRAVSLRRSGRIDIAVTGRVPEAAVQEIVRNLPMIAFGTGLEVRVLRGGDEADIMIDAVGDAELRRRHGQQATCTTDVSMTGMAISRAYAWLPAGNETAAQSCVMRALMRAFGVPGWSDRLPSVLGEADIRTGLTMADMHLLAFLYGIGNRSYDNRLWSVMIEAQNYARRDAADAIFTGAFSGPPVRRSGKPGSFFRMKLPGMPETPQISYDSTLGEPVFRRFVYRGRDGRGAVIDAFPVSEGTTLQPLQQIRATAPGEPDQHYNTDPALPEPGRPKLALSLNLSLACVTFETAPRRFDDLDVSYRFLGKYCRPGPERISREEAMHVVASIVPGSR